MSTRRTSRLCGGGFRAVGSPWPGSREEGDTDGGADRSNPEGELLLHARAQEHMFLLTTECLSQRHEAGDQPGSAGGLVDRRRNQAAHEAAKVAGGISTELGHSYCFVRIC